MAWLKTTNWKPFFTALKAALLAGGPSIISVMQMMGYQASDVEKIIAAVTTVLGLVLLVLDKTSANMVVDAASVPGVQVHVDTLTAPAPVVAAVRTTPDVVPMTGGPVPSDAGKSG